MPESKSIPFSRRFDLARLGDSPEKLRIEANEAERSAIAAELCIPTIGGLVGRFRLARERSGRIEARLDLSARVTQICVVSLDPFEQTLAERVELILLSANEAASGDDDTAIDPDAPDEIVADGEMIDLGALMTEQLALALDPYPRKPGAVPPVSVDNGGKTSASSPFAVLARLRKNS